MRSAAARSTRHQRVYAPRRSALAEGRGSEVQGRADRPTADSRTTVEQQREGGHAREQHARRSRGLRRHRAHAHTPAHVSVRNATDGGRAQDAIR
eukprot:3303248-Pleurochrysis_carterae.AAC.1